jgi:hypothetical protein
VALILQRSTIELLAAYDVAVAPVPLEGPLRPATRPVDHLVGMVQVSDSRRRGTLTLSTSPLTLARTRQVATDLREQLDWMRELTNQFASRAKSKFARYNLPLQVGLPSALSSSAMDRSQVMQQAEIVLVFHALRDEVLCTLSGGFDDSGLALLSDPSSVAAGETILF